MWYDLLVLGILLYFLLRGAAKGLLNQLASIAAIIICLVFAESISAAFGPLVQLEPPLNNWVVMFGAYLVCSFLAFGLARVLTDWIERAKLESFNQHFGAIFGLLKGVVVCLVLTFFLVTLSPASREALRQSRAAYVSAYLVDRLHPIMPQQLDAALSKYLQLYETGVSAEPTDLGQAAGENIPVILPDAVPASGQATGTAGSLPYVPAEPATPAAGTSGVDRFVAQLPFTVDPTLRQLIAQSLANTPPDQRAQAQQQLWNLLQQARPADLQMLQQQLLVQGRQGLGPALAAWANSFVAPTPSHTPATAPVAPAPQVTPPAPLTTAPQTRQDELLADISRAYSTIPPVQVQVQADIRRRMTGLPADVVLGVLEDWRRDLWAPQTADPDPSTDANATLEVRILRQLQSRRIPVNQLSREVQERLEGATLR